MDSAFRTRDVMAEIRAEIDGDEALRTGEDEVS